MGLKTFWLAGERISVREDVSVWRWFSNGAEYFCFLSVWDVEGTPDHRGSRQVWFGFLTVVMEASEVIKHTQVIQV